MSENTITRPANWTAVEGGDDNGGKLYVGPEFIEPNAEWGVKLMWDRDGLCYGLSSDTSVDTLGRDDLLELRTAIEQALAAGDKLN